MPLIDYGSLKSVLNNVIADVLNEIPTLDPSIPASSIKAIVESFAAAIYENRLLIAQGETQAFPQTSTSVYIERWAEYDGLTRNVATIASGFLTATGTIGVEIPLGSLLNSQSSVILTTQVSATIQNIETSITSLNRSGSIVTAVTSTDHKLATGVLADITGATETDYNGTFTVTVVDEFTFTYIISATPTTPATGTISVDFDGAELSVSTQDTGLDQNIGAANIATFASPILNVDNTARVRFDGIEGGTDDETDDELRTRVLEHRATIQSLFSRDFLINLAKTVAGVTRVFIKEAYPEAGQTEVYFMRDNDPSSIPSGIDVENVNTVLQSIRPVNMAEVDFVIAAPTAVSVDVSLSSLVPDTETMRNNIESVLADFFTFQIEFEQDVLLERITGALFFAKDTDTGLFLESFTLDAPASDVVIDAGEIAILGTITIL